MSEQPQDLRPRTKAFALRVIRMYSKLLKNDTVAQVLGKQVLRSGTSVGANYREASRARSKAEFISKIGDCLKEVDETEYWLELLVESGCVSTAKMEGLLNETIELIAIFTTIHKRSKTALKLFSSLGHFWPSLYPLAFPLRRPSVFHQLQQVKQRFVVASPFYTCKLIRAFVELRGHFLRFFRRASQRYQHGGKFVNVHTKQTGLF